MILDDDKEYICEFSTGKKTFITACSAVTECILRYGDIFTASSETGTVRLYETTVKELHDAYGEEGLFLPLSVTNGKQVLMEETVEPLSTGKRKAFYTVEEAGEILHLNAESLTNLIRMYDYFLNNYLIKIGKRSFFIKKSAIPVLALCARLASCELSNISLREENERLRAYS